MTRGTRVNSLLLSQGRHLELQSAWHIALFLLRKSVILLDLRCARDCDGEHKVICIGGRWLHLSCQRLNSHVRGQELQMIEDDDTGGISFDDQGELRLGEGKDSKDF